MEKNSFLKKKYEPIQRGGGAVAPTGTPFESTTEWFCICIYTTFRFHCTVRQFNASSLRPTVSLRENVFSH